MMNATEVDVLMHFAPFGSCLCSDRIYRRGEVSQSGNASSSILLTNQRITADMVPTRKAIPIHVLVTEPVIR
jgi:hypothetical protein